MLPYIYIRIYVLSSPVLLGVCVFCLICFLLLAYYCRGRWWWKPILGSTLVLWAVVVLYSAILSHLGGIESVWVAVPFHSYREVLSGGNPENIAYIGDDANDLDCIRWCGFTGCPADAVPEVLEAVHYVCRREGGRGAVREFISRLQCNP